MYYNPAAMGERICNELFTWADVYDTANHDERRAILQQFIKEIRVRKDYEILDYAERQLQPSGAAQGCVNLRWCGNF